MFRRASLVGMPDFPNVVCGTRVEGTVANERAFCVHAQRNVDSQDLLARWLSLREGNPEAEEQCEQCDFCPHLRSNVTSEALR